jgi:RNA methyltransferase, TrmH family
MVSRSQSALVKSLKLKKYRQQSNLFVAEGTKAVTEILVSPLKVLHLFATGGWMERNTQLDLPAHTIATEAEMKKLSHLSTPSEVLALVEMPENPFSYEVLHSKLSLYLDSIRDPGNLGTLVRLADWFGLEHIICSDDCVDAFNPKAVQASMGSIGRVAVHYLEPDAFWAGLPEMPVLAADMQGESIFSSHPKPEGLLAIGSESHGLSPLVRSRSTQFVSIPRKGKAESLNAAMAAGIILGVVVFGSSKFEV